MADQNQTPPPAPEGFKALWQDPGTMDWVLVDKDLDVACWNACLEEWDYQYDFDQSQVARELLRVAAERDELRAEVERLNQENEALMNNAKGMVLAKVIDCSKGKHDWKKVIGTESIHECQVCGRQSGK